MKLFPEVRTLQEAGIDLVVNSPYGVCGPRGLDAAVVKTLHDAMKEALLDPATQGVGALQHADALSRQRGLCGGLQGAGSDRAREPQARGHAGQAIAPFAPGGASVGGYGPRFWG